MPAHWACSCKKTIRVICSPKTLHARAANPSNKQVFINWTCNVHRLPVLRLSYKQSVTEDLRGYLERIHWTIARHQQFQRIPVACCKMTDAQTHDCSHNNSGPFRSSCQSTVPSRYCNVGHCFHELLMLCARHCTVS